MGTVMSFKMKLALCHIFLATMATSMPAEDKLGKAFSLFNIVTFPNKQCTTQMSNDMFGICVTVEECNGRSGQISGNCASGFGVCCFTAIEATGSGATISNNLTYITNEGFPNTVGGTAPVTAQNYQFPIAATSDIKSIRIDFDTGIFSPPTDLTGVCANDIIRVNSAGIGAAALGFDFLCGTLTGQHIYIPTGHATAGNQLNIETNAAAFTRSWKILIRLIESGNPGLPENDQCLQYFTGASGNIRSFNDVTAAGAQGQLISRLRYSACIRLEKGYRCVTLRENTAAANDAFQLDPANAAAQMNAACDTEWITLNRPERTTNLQQIRLCGSFLSDMAASTLANPVASADGIVHVRALTDVRINPSSFDLRYSQGC